jgi:hypothetical protein
MWRDETHAKERSQAIAQAPHSVTASMGDREEAAAAAVLPQWALPSATRHAKQIKAALVLAFTHLREKVGAAEANLGTGCRVAAVSDVAKAILMP